METNNQNLSTLEPNENPPSLYDRIVNSVILKMAVIFFLTILMLIPLNLVNDLIQERKFREVRVSSDISAKWGQSQVVSSPIIAVPFKYTEETIEKDAKGKESVVRSVVEDWIFILPEKSEVKIDVTPEYLKRGIYQSVVYTSNLDVRGTFSKLDVESLNLTKDAINWSQAKLVVGVQDVKGVSITPQLNFAGNTIPMKMNGKLFTLFPNNLVADLKLTGEEGVVSSFQISYELKGSKSLNFLPLANQTKLNIKGAWGNPSFNGGYLPDSRDVQDSSFTAEWNIPSFARKLPQQWIGQSQVYDFQDLALSEETIDYVSEVNASSAAQSNAVSNDLDMIQVNFLPEVNNYQKTTRVAKYGILVIALTFASLFFTEIIKKQRIHLIQYILIGAAMVLFYSLLLAFSEHFGFNIAYLVSGLATIFLIAFFILMITKNRYTAFLFAGILVLFYTFIYVLMQLRDYSLIVGTVGIFIILAVLMRVSTKVNWSQFDRK
ncbi:cell envelope integrity protein CreD [Sphingobacterium bovistauri]|uniref:Cell envelope integrity protein CreD n=1 Tax=Sphingobacterium bovistauri TaxID=2781959 RepID=A0ABS7Z8Z0_9SPHI|nr:cell envelope integrity protein CreD [Sphingobacterium bovistauri]MCA5006620.1 cell envelope integrity protein CreD [Sphingobacterium bovistauri]